MKYKKQTVGEYDMYSPQEESKLFKITLAIITLAVLAIVVEFSGLADSFIALWK